MNPLLHRLGVVRRRYQVVTFFSGVFAVTAFVVGLAAAVGLFDYVNHLPRLLRASALVGLLAGAGYLLYRLLIHPLARKSDDLSLALRIEALYPELNDALASTIQFLDQPDAPSGGDKQMRAKAIEKATLQAASFDFHAILDYRFLGMSALAVVAALAVAGHFLYREPDLSSTALLRLGDPFGHHPWTRIDVPEAVKRIAVGKPFRLEATVQGVVPPNVKIEVQAKNPFSKKYESRPDIVLPVKFEPGKRAGTAATPLDVSQKPLEFQYRIKANDGSFPPQRNQWYKVEVLQPPSFVELDGLPSPQIELHYPRYTGLASPARLSPGTRHLDMIQGTEVVLRAAVDRPLKSATIELKPLDQALRLASLTALVAEPTFLPQLGPAAFHNSFSWFHPIELDSTRTKLSARFRPWVAGSYTIHLLDDSDLGRPYEADLRVAIDPVPQVQLRRPAVSQSYLPTAEVPVQTLAEDSLFAVRTVFLEYRRKNAQGDWLDKEPTRIAIYDPALVGGAWRAATKSVLPFELLMPVRPQRMELTMLWNLKKQFKVGEIIALQAGADDFCDVFTPRLAGRSHEIEIRIVSGDELVRQIEENVMQVQQELVALKRIEDDAQKLLNDIPKDKHDEKALDQAIEAAQKAKQVEERIGKRPNEGLRDKLEKIQQTIKDNKLPNSEVQDQVKALSQELERLVQEEFPKLEQNLNDLRKELAGSAKPQPEKQKSPLEKSRESNKEIQKTLNELTRALDRWADLAQLKGQTRELIEKQRAISEKTEALKKPAELAEGIPEAEKAIREDAEKLGAEERKLEQEAKELLGRINEVKGKKDEIVSKEGIIAEEDDDKEAKARADDAKDASKKLRDALDVARNGELGKSMKDAADDLKNVQPNASQEKQQQAAKTLEQMVKALEGQKDDDLDRLRKKQKDANAAQNEVGKLNQKVDQLRKAQKNKVNADERKKQAEDLRNAADDLREQARQLQRLQEQKAARELQKAAENLDDAAKKLEAGEVAEAEQLEMEAQEHIAQAQQQLEHLQQELAREQLARIEDRLKGLKERQDAAIERTNDLQTKVEAKNRWSPGLLETLDAEAKSQQGLAKETQSLEEKLKGALVFEHILKKAGKAMEQAGEMMVERKKISKDRQLAEVFKDELADEKTRHTDTVRLQKLAADRLDRLLEALKNTPPPKQAKKKEPPKENPEGKPPEQQGGMRGGDGIPPMAQLKALKAEQVEILERTKEFAKTNPDPMNLNEARQRELRELTEEQGRLRQLFEQMTNRPKDGDMP
jgi:hypothetical protein